LSGDKQHEYSDEGLHQVLLAVDLAEESY
jgi:hypothetical protein